MYGFTTRLAGLSFDEAIVTTAALKAEGLRILGVCNSPLAWQAIQTGPDIGRLLPCNAIVPEEAAGRVVVDFLDSQIMVGQVNKPEVNDVADLADQRLRCTCQSLGGSSATTS